MTTLFLIPNLLAENTLSQALPITITSAITHLRHFMVENERNARRFLKLLSPQIDINALSLVQMPQTSANLKELLAPLFTGEDVGLISDAGLPCIADPGAMVVDFAHKHNITVKPLVGPSSIMLALMASGLNGQSFAFNGYLPINTANLKQRLLQLQSLVFKTHQTQIFIETPYRNHNTLKTILETCNKNLKLTIATNLMAPNELIKTAAVGNWQANLELDLNRNPTVFLLGD